MCLWGIHSLEGEKEEKENTNEKQSELLGVACLAISPSIFQKGGALQSTRSWGVSGVTVSTLRKISNGLASSKRHKTTSSVGKMVLSPDSIHPGLKARSWGCTHPRSSTITALYHHFLPQVQGLGFAYVHPHTWSLEPCRSL